MHQVKFSVFADLHYVPEAFMSHAEEKLEKIQKRAEQENAAFIIHAGDYCHGPDKAKEFVKKYNDFHIKSYHCLGNHDSDNTDFKTTVELYEMPSDYYYFDENGFRFIVLNPNYYEADGEFIPYSLGNYYSTTGSVGVMPPAEVEWLKKTIDEANCPCVLFSHQSFERADGIKNAKEVRDVIDNANKKRKHSVIMCINGHYHRDYVAIKEDVVYFDFNSASYDWVNTPHHFYPKELEEKYSCLANTINVNEDIHAIITLTEEKGACRISVQGMKGTYFMGITTEMTDNPPFDEAGRPYTTDVSSFDITLN